MIRARKYGRNLEEQDKIDTMEVMCSVGQSSTDAQPSQEVQCLVLGTGL